MKLSSENLSQLSLIQDLSVFLSPVGGSLTERDRGRVVMWARLSLNLCGGHA